MNIFKLLGGLIPSIGRSIEQAVEDKDLANRLTQEIEKEILSIQATALESKAGIIVAEAQGQSWIQRSWRPITMLTFVVIIANNYIFVPYAVSFGLTVPMLEIPPGMWSLLTIGIGGYIGGRTYEKTQEMKYAAEAAANEEA